MKRIIAVLILSVFALCCLSAFEPGDLSKDFTFKALVMKPIYEPYMADQWSVETRAQYINLLGGDYLYQVLLCTRYEAGREDRYHNYDRIQEGAREDFIMEEANFRDEDNGVKQLYRVKTGFSFSALRVSYKDVVSAEACVQGALNLVFDANGGTDCLGFDGIYFYGLNASVYDGLFSFRIGRHHYSGHYGDEIEESFMLRKDEKGRVYANRFLMGREEGGYISRFVQYVRQDSLVIGLSSRPLPWLRVYAEADVLTPRMHRVRPWLLVPEGTMEDDCDHTLEQGIGCSEGVYASEGESRKAPYSKSYKAMSFNFGVEVEVPIEKVGSVVLAFDMKLNQEGQTAYQIGAYSEDNPWDVDYNVLLGLSLEGSGVTAELIYHNGRVPLMNFFWKHCSYWSAGFSITY